MERPRATLDLSVRCDARAPAAARRAMGSMCAIGSSLPDATLIVSELVAKAVRRSPDNGPGAIAVSVHRFPNRLMIRVKCPGAGGSGAPRSDFEDTPVDGYGQRILERLASRWGTDEPDGIVSWAELPLRTCS